MKKRRIATSSAGDMDECGFGPEEAKTPTRFGFRIALRREARVCHAARRLKDLLPLVALIAGFGVIGACAAVGYSYARFEGPVAGPEHLVTVHDGRTVDYVARPDYSFAYGVEDGNSRVLQNRKETRTGDEVRGVYSVVDPDGTLRVVKYTADDANGFQAEVITNGVKTLHGHGAEVDAGGGTVDNQVRHDSSEAHEADDEEGEEQEEEEAPHAAPHKGNGQYKVHEDYDEGGGGGEEKEKDAEGEEEGDHQEYEGSSEEGYVEADAHSQQEEASSEDY
ncbi:cyclic nucleotide-gated cation channel beta-1 [Drosophila elegans]|uniref:cyclic nucleotide-gated cation channel beta-1 n=1 Tax=Drosophila elegans TaxID=30023 RepID=UPI0007E7ED24|nr:cyclic nucleotide-gated cation channel beta-1 [Drosophila elegans]